MAIPAQYVVLSAVFMIVYVITTSVMVRSLGKLSWQKEARKALEDLTAAVERLTVAMDGVHFVVDDDGRLHAQSDRR